MILDYTIEAKRHAPDHIFMNYVTTQYSLNMKLHFGLFLVLVLLNSCYGNKTEDSEAYLSHFIADLWLEGTTVLKIIWRDCSKKVCEKL